MTGRNAGHAEDAGGDAPAEKRRRLTLEDRIDIQGGLDRGQRVSKIAAALGRTSQVIADEIKRNRTKSTEGFRVVSTRNICVHADLCTRSNVCGDGCDRGSCYNCPDWKCNANCPDFKAKPCEKLRKSPFCCNACPSLGVGRGCMHEYLLYNARVADEDAATRKKESRKGVDMTPEQLAHAREVVRDGLSKGQSPSHILAAHPELDMTPQTMYNHINEGLYGVGPIDLVNAVKRRKGGRSKGKYEGNGVPRGCLEGRRYADWEALSDEEKASTVEMDTVVGRRGVDKQCLLSLQWPGLVIQLYPLLAACRAEDVVEALDMIQSAIGLDEFRRIMPILKTDRGGEFSDAQRIEHDADGNKRCRLFYCDAYKSQQKPHAERSHQELRRILRKGKTNFDALTRSDAALIMSHVNSMPRPQLFGASPISMAKGPLGNLLDALNVLEIPAGEVNLTPLLVPHTMLPGTAPGRKVGPKG